jgi:hypothetical protein
VKQILAMTRQNRLNTTSEIVPDWDCHAFELRRNGNELAKMPL